MEAKCSEALYPRDERHVPCKDLDPRPTGGSCDYGHTSDGNGRPAPPPAPAPAPAPVPVGASTFGGHDSFEQRYYAGKHSVIFGAMQICCGVISVLTHAVCFSSLSNMWNLFLRGLFHGIWCGAFFILAGAFACAAGVKKTRGLIMTNMVMCIIASVLAGIQSVLSALLLVLIQHLYDRLPDSREGAAAESAILLACGLTAFVVSIWSSSLSCKAICCREALPQEIVVHYAIVNQTGSSQGIVSLGDQVPTVVSAEMSNAPLYTPQPTAEGMPPPYSEKPAQ